MRELSLFTGNGGGLLGTKLLGFQHIGYIEIDDYCQKVIAQRIKDGYLDDAPIFGDIRTFIDEGYADAYSGLVDIVTAGFPCQPFSRIGKKQQENDDRNMWPQTIDIISRVNPRLCFLENVPGLIDSEYFGEVLRSLAQTGYDTIWQVVPACAVAAPHTRERLFILAYPTGKHGEVRMGSRQTKQWEIPRGSYRKMRQNWLDTVTRNAGSGSGIPNRVDRLRTIGNSQVPAVVKTVWELLTK